MPPIYHRHAPTKVLQSRRRSLQTLRTAQAEITVTSSHRVVVFENDLRSERRAGDLRDGDILLCGTRRQRLMRVIPLERNTEAGSTWCRLPRNRVVV